jgi:hypothetical protein
MFARANKHRADCKDINVGAAKLGVNYIPLY